MLTSPQRIFKVETNEALLCREIKHAELDATHVFRRTLAEAALG